MVLKVFNLQIGLFVPVLLASRGAVSFGDHKWYADEQAFAPSPQEKAQARSALDEMIASLSGVDAAYTSGNATEARAKLAEATFSWNKISLAISAREAGDPKQLLNSLICGTALPLISGRIGSHYELTPPVVPVGTFFCRSRTR